MGLLDLYLGITWGKFIHMLPGKKKRWIDLSNEYICVNQNHCFRLVALLRNLKEV